MNDATKTRLQALGIGVAGMGALGGGVGAIVGEKGKKGKAALVGTGIGMGVGVIGGLIWGDYVVKKKTEYNNAEEALRANIEAIDARIKTCRTQNSKLEQEIAQAKKNGGIAKADRDRLQQEATAARNQITQDISVAKSNLKGESGENASQLSNRIAALEQQRRSLDNNISSLSKLRVRG